MRFPGHEGYHSFEANPKRSYRHPLWSPPEIVSIAICIPYIREQMISAAFRVSCIFMRKIVFYMLLLELN